MPKTARQKVSEYRSRLRGRGLRPVQIWVPDTRDPRIAERIRNQARALRNHPSSAEVEPLLDAALADIDGWTA